MAKLPDDPAARERELLAQALVRAAQGAAGPRPRALKGLRKVSTIVERTWVSAGCFGEAVQWKLKGP